MWHTKTYFPTSQRHVLHATWNVVYFMDLWGKQRLTFQSFKEKYPVEKLQKNQWKLNFTLTQVCCTRRRVVNDIIRMHTIQLCSRSIVISLSFLSRGLIKHTLRRIPDNLSSSAQYVKEYSIVNNKKRTSSKSYLNKLSINLYSNVICEIED
jgi:hypothetical protein